MGRCNGAAYLDGPRGVTRLGALVFSVLAFTAAAHAAPFSWTGTGGDNLWSNANNWSPVGVPGSLDDVTIPAGATPVEISTANVTVTSLNLSRRLDVAGGRTLVVATAALAGEVRLGGAAVLSGGTYTIGAGGNITFPTLCNYARLSNVTVNGDITAFSGGLRWNNVTLNGTLTATSGSEIVFEGNQTLTGTLAASTAATLTLAPASAGTLTISASGAIRGGNINITNSAQCIGTPFAFSVVNNGTIDASIAGRSITLNAPVTNNGTMNSGPGSVLVNSTFNPSTGTVTGTGFQAPGTLDLAGGTWNFNAGTWNITGTLQNGTVNLGGGTLTFPALCSYARVSNLTINGNLPNFSGGLRWNNVTLNGTLTATGGGELRFEGNQTLTGNFVANTTSTLTLTPFTAGTLTIASTATLRGGNISISDTSQCTGVPLAFTVVNNGTIDADTAGRTITVAAALTNSASGQIKVGPGNVTINGFDGNSGTIAQTGGTLTFGGSTKLASLGTYTRSAGSVALAGVADLASSSWSPLGAWTISGTIQNGTVNLASGTLTFPALCTYGRLSNVTVNGDLPNFTGGLRWNNVTLNGTLTATGQGEIVFEGNQSLSGAIAANTSSTLALAPFSAGTLTIAASGAIRGGNISITNTPQCTGVPLAFSVVNNGTIDANIAGRSITFNAVITNNGTINSGPGAIVIPGTLNPTGGTITGTGFQVPGTLDLGGAVWSLNSGTWNITGTVQNGTVSLGGGSLAFPALCNFARLSNLTINGSLPNFSGGMRWNNVTLNGTLTATGQSEIRFEGNQTLTGTIVANTTSTLSLTPFSTGTLTIASTAILRGGNISMTDTPQCTGTPLTFAVINNGTIDADTAGRTITLSAALTNSASGRIKVGLGNLIINGFNGNNGSIAQTGGSLTFGGNANLASLGTYTRTGGSAAVTGVADLANSSWSPLGLWAISGTIQNGTVNLANGAFTFPGLCNFGRFSNLIVNGDIPAFAGGLRWNNVTLNGTLTATGQGEIGFEGSQTVTGTIAANAATALTLAPTSAGTLTIAANATIRGGNVNISNTSQCTGIPLAFSVINNGTIDADIAGRTITLAAPLTNNGTLRARPNAVVNINASATTLAAAGTLSIDLKGPPTITANYGRITLANTAGSTIALGGKLKINNVDGYTPTCGLVWDIIKSALAGAGTPVTGTFSILDFPFAGEANLQRIVYGPKVTSYFIASGADFDQDGFITFEDFDAFIASFENGDDIADFNADGFLTFEDFDAFVAKFEGGC